MLKDERMNAGIGQRELSRRAGVHRRSIQEYEKRGFTGNTVENLRKLKKFFGCSYEDLLD